jgi:hypothetical protein
MNTITRKLILMQGYNQTDIENCHHINILVRWTPLLCSLLGLFGVLIKSPTYLIILGLLTTIGAFSTKSFYDYLYDIGFRYIFGLGKIPGHGNARRFGCAIGSMLYISSGIGFLIENSYLAYIPSFIIISLAFTAATTQWCFASTLYNLLFRKNETCCIEDN